MTALYAIQLLNMISLGLSTATSIAREIEWARGKLQSMIDEDRDPTDEEWEELNKRTEELRDSLHTD